MKRLDGAELLPVAGTEEFVGSVQANGLDSLLLF